MYRSLILVLCLFAFACAPNLTATSQTSTKDVELDAAIQQARDSLDVFIERIASPHGNRTLVAVKVRFFSPDGSSQDIWADGVTYTDDTFRGHMGDDIPALKLKFDEKITIPREDILDWMIVEDGKLIGGYTIRLAVQRMSPEEKERFLKTLDYSIDD
jgi:uncharacterized protein YegJ (DUF2314 family)